MPHTCHAIDCTTPCPSTHLFCRRHWMQLPGLLRARIMREYRPGQCKDRKPSEKWIALAREAQEALKGEVAV